MYIWESEVTLQSTRRASHETASGVYRISTTIFLPRAVATFSIVESLMSSA